MTIDFFITDAPDSDDYFPDDNFFPDVDNLFDDMAGEDTDPRLRFIYAESIYLLSVRTHDLFYLYYISHALSTISVNKIIW